MEKLKEYFKELEIELSEKQLTQFQTYYDLLIEWNSVMNLTAITEPDEVMKKHYLDSVCLCKGKNIDLINDTCVINRDISLIDIGTGAGFPSIPLKIVYPNLKITMLDSLNKRVKFLNAVIEALKLKNIEAIHGRAEDYAKPEKLREKYDICVSRAVANLATLSEYCLPYVRKGGLFIAYKSEELEKERESAAKAIYVLGGQIEEVVNYTLPQTDYFRNLCIIRKNQTTPKKYPRKAGLPSKEPLT